MKRYKLLVVLVLLCISSCAKTATETVIEKEIVYLQKVNDTLLRVNLPRKNGDLHQFKILKDDSLFSTQKEYNSRKYSFERFDSIYNISATFEDKHIEIGKYDEYIQKTELIDITISPNINNSKKNYLLKKLTQRYQDFKLTGFVGNRHNLQYFDPNARCLPVKEFNFYADALKIYHNEGYLMSIDFGCCTNTPVYHLFDIEGNYILSSNHTIKFLVTDRKKYFIGVLKNEIPDFPIIFIQDTNKNVQFIRLSKVNIDNILDEHFYLKFKNELKANIENNTFSLKQYNIKTLDELEIWIPFNKTDTLKIPFKNQKAFGIEYPQIKVSLAN